MKNTTLSWILFVVIAGTMGFLRYGDFLSPDQMALFRKYGPWVIIVVHFILVLIAFKDTVFQGILCLVIPFYSFYWLFVVSDLFLLRAVVAGLLAGFGQDTAVFLQTEFSRIVSGGKGWIESGGGK